MADNMVERFTNRDRGIAAALPEADAPEADLGCFGWLRGIRERAVSLEFRKKDGRVLAIGYAWIDRLEYDPDNGITLHAAGKTVRLEGAGLNHEARPGVRLFEGITRHRVTWVRECNHNQHLETADRAVQIDAIVWNN